MQWKVGLCMGAEVLMGWDTGLPSKTFNFKRYTIRHKSYAGGHAGFRVCTRPNMGTQKVPQGGHSPF